MDLVMDVPSQTPPQARSITFEVMDRTGETKLIWDAENPDDIENARRTFKDLTKKGYWCHKVTGKNGETGERVTEFDPSAERYVFAPAMRGG